MTTEVRVVSSEADRQAVYRLRYRVYVQDMKREQRYANSLAQTIQEPLDATGIILAAYEGAEVVGTVRHNYARSSDLGYYEDLYRMRSARDPHLAHSCITTKLIVDSKHQNGRVGIALAVAAYRQVLADGIRWNYIDCNDHLVRMFSKMGFRVRGKVAHPEFGEVNAMLLDVKDLDNLVAVGSPFARHLVEHVQKIGERPLAVSQIREL